MQRLAIDIASGSLSRDIALQAIQAVTDEVTEEFASVVHLTANENVMSSYASAALSSPLGQRYHLGVWSSESSLPSGRSYIDLGLQVKGCASLIDFEQRAFSVACELFSASYCDFRLLSGLHAVTSLIATATEPGDTVAFFPPETIGHHATESLVRRLGRTPLYLPWDPTRLDIDTAALGELLESQAVAMILLDLGAPLYPLDIVGLRAVVGGRSLIVYDGSHVLGLIAGQTFQNPLLEGCDVLIGNTHKTFPGPQKAMILYASSAVGVEIADRINLSAVSSQHTHHTLALFISLFEVALYGRDYARQIIANAQALHQELKDRGFQLVTHGNSTPCTHMLFIEGPFPEGHHAAGALLHECGINTNSKRFLGREVVRLGVQEVTRLGMKEQQMAELAGLMADALLAQRSPTWVREAARRLTEEFRTVHYSLDAV